MMLFLNVGPFGLDPTSCLICLTNTIDIFTSSNNKPPAAIRAHIFIILRQLYLQDSGVSFRTENWLFQNMERCQSVSFPKNSYKPETIEE